MRGFPFTGRTAELSVLESEYAQGNGFVVIYGRRRVGKTALIRQFIQGKQALYFLASKEDDAINRQRFCERAARLTGNHLLASATFADWRAPFQAIVQDLEDRPCVIAIDEFPYLVAANRAMPSIMQGIWDELLDGTNIMLILCGSSMSMMRDEVLSAKSPLYGRRTAQIKLQPLPFASARQALAGFSYEQAVEAHAITGGVPKYLEFFCNEPDVEACACQHAFSSSGYLYQEPEFLLAEETRGAASYLSILSAVAQGNRKLSEISNFLGRRAQDLSPYLAALVSLGFLERSAPFTERYPERSKNGLYRVSDGFMAFWLTYVEPFAGELEMGNMLPSLEAMGRTFRSKFVPFAFERIAAEDFARLCAADELAFCPCRIAGYWNRTGSVELDVCANDYQRNQTFLGECKYYERKPVGMPEYKTLLRKADAVPCLGDGTLLGLFSHTGFSNELMELAQQDDRLVLVDKGARVA